MRILLLLINTFALYGLPNKILPTYYETESKAQVQEFLNDPDNHGKSLQVAAFDLVKNCQPEQCEKTAYNECLRFDFIKSIKEKNIYLSVDIAESWGNYFKSWEKVTRLLTALTQAGIDAVNFDEWIAWQDKTSNLTVENFLSLQKKLRSINPKIEFIVTEVKFESIQNFLEKGAKPNYISLAWYTVDPTTAAKNFENCKKLEEKYLVKCMFYVDPKTYEKGKISIEKYGQVAMWNLCWRGKKTCPNHPDGTKWLSYPEIKKIMSSFE